jgi:prepilin-type N-terminal cleavage/methylation domain-containing protein
MRNTTHNNGFTLVELLVALIVTSIVTTAVVTLAYALNTVDRATDDTSKKQAQVRFATLRISDLIRNGRLVCYASPDEMAIWTEDKADVGKINLNEVTYIEAGAAHDHLQLYTFTGTAEISRDLVGALATNWWSTYGSRNPPTPLIPQCSNVTFYLDVSPPNSRLVTIKFDIVENGATCRNQMNSTLHGWAGNLLGTDGNIVPDDD